jgi:pseudaminic acid synthase
VTNTELAGVRIGWDNPCRFVAEISNAHNGDRDRCGRLIDAAQAAGADFVKFQAYTPKELVALRGNGPAPEPWGSQGHTMLTLYQKAQTPLEWFPKIAAHCDRVGIPWFASAFGTESLWTLQTVGCPFYKIAALEFGNRPHRELLEGTGKQVVRSVPRNSTPAGGGIFLYCPPGYPQTKLDLKSLRNGFTGFSYHGTDYSVASVAVAAGAKLFECHFQLGDEPSDLEGNVSLDEDQFRAMVDSVRATERLL